jgi:phosphoenolpyruvate-protein phosphotransferase
MGEVSIAGVSAAPGITLGRAMLVDRVASAPVAAVGPGERGAEVARARGALLKVAEDLERIAASLRADRRDQEAEIVETGVLMAMDPELAARVESLILDTGLEAADALREASEQTAMELSRLGDRMLAERADDVRSVGRRAAAHIEGVRLSATNAVLIAATLGPADVAELAPSAAGIALAGGGVTAHAAIVARSLGLPMVVGLGGDLLQIEDGEEVVVDGSHGVVVRRPDPARVEQARKDTEGRRLARESAVSRRLEPAETRDGRRLRVLANASTVAELEEASHQGAEGVGLLRTELLFLDAPEWPSFDRQVGHLRPVLSRLSGRTATVRLFDFGGDKTPPFLRGVATRGIELLLEYPERLREHIQAIVAAAADVELRILIPMVGDPGEVSRVRAMVGDRAALVGAMIETASAASGAREIAGVSDFLSIGTNDLTQSVLGLDREHSKTAPVTDVRVLRLIDATVRAAHDAGIVVDVCGEAGSDPNAMPLLVGLGVDELSVAAARVGQVRQWVRELDYEDCAQSASRLLDQARHASGERV